MHHLFSSPLWLCGLLPLAGLLGWAYLRLEARLRDRRHQRRLILRGLLFLLLCLAVAGLHLPEAARPVELVAIVDTSASLYEKAQLKRPLAELAKAFHPLPQATLAVLFCGRNVELQARLRHIPDPGAPEPAGLEGTASQAGSAEGAAFRALDPLRPSRAIDETATDLGAAIHAARGLFSADSSAARALVLISDGLDTEGQAGAAAAALEGASIDLLAWPAHTRPGKDLHLAGLALPERGFVGRGIPIRVTVGASASLKAVVRLARREGERWVLVGERSVELVGELPPGTTRLTHTLTFADYPQRQGIAVYQATVSGPPDQPLYGDFRENNQLLGAIRIHGEARWAVLAPPESTLGRWAQVAGTEQLGVALQLFPPGALPSSPEAYDPFAGILVGGLSAQEFPEGGAGLQALAEAVRGSQGGRAGGGPLSAGKALVAVGGPQAFGAGRHPKDGQFERLLPVTFRPDDDRTRTILFVVDVSRSMESRLASGEEKLLFAKGQLGRVVQQLRPTDRVGLIAFSGTARLCAAVSGDPGRGPFIQALTDLGLANQTEFLAPLREAAKVLAKDDAEEQLVVLLSDGKQETVGGGAQEASEEELRAAVTALCPAGSTASPPRTRLYTFGIGTGAQDGNAKGEALMRSFAKWGHGAYFPEFLQLAERLEQVFNQEQADLYSRREPMVLAAPYPHPVLGGWGSLGPLLPWRNRVKARAGGEVLLESQRPAGEAAARGSRRPDPLLVLGHLGAARSAVLALSLDGVEGEALLRPDPQTGWQGGKALLAALLSWAEARPQERYQGCSFEARIGAGGRLELELRARQAGTGRPWNGLSLKVRMGALVEGEAEGRKGAVQEAVLHPVGPGRYQASLASPPQGVYRLEVLEGQREVLEQFLTVPYAAEYQRFGTDRLALAELVRQAGGHSRLINHPQKDLLDWYYEQKEASRSWPLLGVLVFLALLCLLAEVYARGMRVKAGPGG